MIGRLSVYAPSRADGEVLLEGVRWYFGLVWIVHEAKRSLSKLRTLLCGHGPQPSELAEPEVASVCAPSSGDGEATGPASSRDEDLGWSENAGSPPKPKGGHRPGTGCLDADASTGATRVAGRHEDLAGGQRGPVGGQGTLYARPAGGEGRMDGHALRSARRYE